MLLTPSSQTRQPRLRSMKHLSRVGHGLVSNKGKLYFHPRGNEVVLSNLLLQPLHRPLHTSFLLPLFLIPFPLPTLFLPAFTQFSRCVHFLSDLPHPCCSSVGFDPLAGFLALQRESCFLFLLVAFCLCWVGPPSRPPGVLAAGASGRVMA